MRPNVKNTYKNQAGLGLVSAIFVIVVLAMLVVGMSSIMTASQTYRSQEVLAVRALSAAQTGSELHLSNLLHPENAPLECTTDATPVVLTTPGLLDCSYQANCESVTITDTYVTIESVGRCGSGVDSATRIVKVRVAL